MDSLYKISDDLLSIFNEIEMNEGEITEELLEQLQITKDNLDEKLRSYKRAIRVWEADVNACKEEEKRIKNARSVKENRISRLKDNMLFAVKTFGQEGKTNRYYELPDGRLFTRTSTSTEIDENRINILISLIIELCKDDIRVFPADEDEFYSFILKKINDKVRMYYEGIEEFTLDDICILTFNYNVEVSMLDLILKYAQNIKDYTDNGLPFTGLTFTPNKPMLKLALQCNKELTIAKLKETESLTIK